MKPVRTKKREDRGQTSFLSADEHCVVSRGMIMIWEMSGYS